MLIEILKNQTDIQQTKVQSLSVGDFLPIWQASIPQNMIFLDVRSPQEFQSKTLPLFISAPLLDDKQHALIGTVYKQQGPSRAMQEGFALSQKHLTERLALWKGLAKEKEAFVLCLRGGLRSRIVTHYLKFFTSHCYQIEGGYKAIRAELLKILENLNIYTFYIFTGRTGAGKTQLLNTLHLPGFIDLEKLAHHRGSAFGSQLQQEQPSQSSFENALLFEILQKKMHPIILEDESRLIGHNLIPTQLKEKMMRSPVIYLDVDRDTRTHHIFQEYVLTPLKLGISKHVLLEHTLISLQKLAKRLGGKQIQVLEKTIRQAFSSATIDKTLHLKYIRKLLEDYYDKRYDYAFNKNKRYILFKGDLEGCKQWLTTHLSV